jgi:hypothetical protein
MTIGASFRHLGPAVLGLIVLIVAGAFAISVDVPRTTNGLKSDEATYIAAALSVAHDGDLSFERRDLERFAGLYHSGPDGILLKRGKQLRVRTQAVFPFVRIVKRDDPRTDRLYFGKAIAYSIAAAPFVRYFGLNGFLVFQVLLLAVAAAAGYLFLSAQMSPVGAAAFTTAYVGASAVPLYGAFLMPEIFNLALVTLAYFLWSYKQVSPDSRIAGRWTDVAAAVLLGTATYSKPLPTAILVAPLVILPWTRRKWMRGLSIGATAVAVAAAWFAFNAAVSGEFNYQGGDRKIFYGRFPFDASGFNWNEQTSRVATDTSTPREVLTSGELPTRFGRNLKYFLIGRHFGFVPYFFPGAVAVVWWLISGARRDRWRLLTFGAACASAVALLILLPWTWNGGGGSPANRYYLTAYPILLFLVPPGASITPGVIAWAGGALFTAKMLVSPFVAARYPYLLVEKGPARRLPVEVTMANDLPLRLAQPLRGHVLYRNDPGVLLYFLDQNAWPPEPTGVGPDGRTIHSMWVSGSGRAEVIIRTPWPIAYLEAEAQSPIRTVLTVSAGDAPIRLKLEPKQVYPFTVKTSGVRGFGDYNYLLTAHSTEGFIPHLMEPGSMDYRNLGAQLRFRPVVAASSGDND